MDLKMVLLGGGALIAALYVYKSRNTVAPGAAAAGQAAATSGAQQLGTLTTSPAALFNDPGVVLQPGSTSSSDKQIMIDDPNYHAPTAVQRLNQLSGTNLGAAQSITGYTN